MLTVSYYLNLRLASRKDQIPVFSQYDLKSASEEELLADAERQLKKVAVGLWQRLAASPIYVEDCITSFRFI